MLRFNLTALVRRARPALARLHRRLFLREIAPTGVMVGNLEAHYARMVRFWWAGARDRVLPAYRLALEQSDPRMDAIMDADSGAVRRLRAVMEELRLEAERLVVQLSASIGEWQFRAELWHRMRWGAALQPHGVNLQTMLAASDVADTLDALLQQNVGLVRNVSDMTRRRIEQVVFSGFTRRAPAREIAREISEAVGIERKRALRIASDQTVKLSAQLDTERMAQAGIVKFEWSHSGKVHFRPHHRARDGQVFALVGEIDPDDMPGVPPFCGCRKRAVLDL